MPVYRRLIVGPKPGLPICSRRKRLSPGAPRYPVARASVSFLGGVREIGGNKILIEDGPDRILFDFGPSFSPRLEEYYANYLQPRAGIGTELDARAHR